MKKQKYPNRQFKGPAKVGTFIEREPLPVQPESADSVRHKAMSTETDESIKRLLGESPYDPAEIILVQAAFLEGWLACEKAQKEKDQMQERRAK